MKLHELSPAPGSRRKRTRVGRGIAAGGGKTAGRGTKGQKARAGGTIPAWFEGGQTPLHQRLPKLRGFRNAFRIEYEIVNVGDVARLVELGVLESGELPGAAAKAVARGKAPKPAPITVNQEILRAAGLVRTLDRPLKVRGGGEVTTALFVVADAFSASARAKIEAAGGTANVIEATGTTTPAIGLAPAAAAVAEAPVEVVVDAPVEAPAGLAEAAPSAAPAKPAAAKASRAKAAAVTAVETVEAPTETAVTPEAPAAAPAKPATRRRKASPSDEPPASDDAG